MKIDQILGFCMWVGGSFHIGYYCVLPADAPMKLLISTAVCAILMIGMGTVFIVAPNK